MALCSNAHTYRYTDSRSQSLVQLDMLSFVPKQNVQSITLLGICPTRKSALTSKQNVDNGTLFIIHCL